MVEDLTPKRRPDDPVIDDGPDAPSFTERMAAEVAAAPNMGAGPAPGSAGGGSPTAGPAPRGGGVAPSGNAVIDAAMQALGVKYQWGGNSLRRGVDCSGLVQQAFLAAGMHVPRTAAAQQAAAKKIRGDAARAGDLVFWNVAGSRDRVPGADHVGIYLGNGYVLEASSGQGRVVVRPLWGNYHFGRIG